MSSVNGTLTPAAVATVTVVADGEGIQIVNRAQSGEIWVRLDGTDPTVAGANCFVVLGVRHFPTRTGTIEARLISSAALAYAVEGLVPVS